MVPHLCGVVVDRAAFGFDDDLLERHVLERIARAQDVQVVYIRLMMFYVMILDGFFAHLRSKRIRRVGELGQYMYHK